MNLGRTIFSQIMEYLPHKEFASIVNKYNGNRYIKAFSCMDQFLCMAFAQITYRESLRDIECCLRAHKEKLYHMGIRSSISKSNLAHANENRNWHIWENFAQVLIGIARNLYDQDSFAVDLSETVYAFDSTTIDLCLSLFPWAHFRKNKAAVKAHTLLDLRGSIPSFVHITTGSVHDVNILDLLPIEPGSYYILDRGYLDFARLYDLTQQGASFITRFKSNSKYRRLYSSLVDKQQGVLCDQIVMLSGFYAKRDYPSKLRRVKYIDAETGKRFNFVTNNFMISALTVAKLCK
jgi:hypothetical protein